MFCVDMPKKELSTKRALVQDTLLCRDVTRYLALRVQGRIVYTMAVRMTMAKAVSPKRVVGEGLRDVEGERCSRSGKLSCF